MEPETRFRIDAVRRAVSDPVRTLRLLRSGIGWRRLTYLLRPVAHGGLTRVDEGLDVRRYPTYQEYLAHQRSKLDLLDLTGYDRWFRDGLAARLGADGDWAGRTVLCLAARIGSEVRAFHDVGAFAVGVDLNPGTDNEYVLPGDFHRLVFPDASVDTVYTNSLDHALDLKRLTYEVARVLRPGGLFLVEAQAGSAHAGFDEWAATVWQSIDDLIGVVGRSGLVLTRRRAITVPWVGEELSFRAPVT